MQEPANRFNLPIVMLLTGFAFMIGGIFKTFSELNWNLGSESYLLIVLAIWLGFLVESSIGMAVLAFLLRRHYPFRKLWVAGTGAFAVGIFISALVINQFFYALWILPGLLVALFFTLFLKDHSEKGSILWVTMLGFLVCQVLLFVVPNENPIFFWLNYRIGPWSVTGLMHMLQDLFIGIFVALGVGLMIRRKSENTLN